MESASTQLPPHEDKDSDRSKITGTQDDVPPDDGTGGLTAAAVAKWTIPSVTALLVVTGYIVQSSHQEMLGLYYSSHDTSSLFLSTADFLRFLTGFLVAALRALSGDPLPLAGYGPALIAATVLASGALWYSRGKKGIAWKAGLLALLLALLLGKFVVLDEPLLHVRNVVSAREDVSVDSAGQDRKQILERVRGAEGDPRSDQIITDVVCSRMHNLAVEDTNLKVSEHCRPAGNQAFSRERHSRALSGRLNAQIWSTALILLVAVVLLQRQSRSLLASAAGILAILYSLMVPYAYGKLRMSSSYDVGIIRLAGPRGAPEGTAGPDRQALILSRDAAGAVLLATRPLQCLTSEGSAGEPAVERTRTTLAFVPASQIVNIERILRYDVIEWAYNNESQCPRNIPTV